MKKTVFERAREFARNKPHVYWDSERASWMYVVDGMDSSRSDWSRVFQQATEWCQRQNQRWRPVDK